MPREVHEVSIDVPLFLTDDQDITAEEMILAVRDRLTVDEDLDMPSLFVERVVETSDRYVIPGRIHVEGPVGFDPFEAVAQAVSVDGVEIEPSDMSSWGAIPSEEFDGTIHMEVDHAK